MRSESELKHYQKVRVGSGRRREDDGNLGKVWQVAGVWRVVKQDLRGLQGLAVSRAFGDYQMKEPQA